VRQIGLRELPVRRKELPSCASLGKLDSRMLSFSGGAVTPEPKIRTCSLPNSVRSSEKIPLCNHCTG